MTLAYPPQPDRDSAPWWARAGRREFAVQECDSCGTLRFPPRAFCAACRREAWHWRRIAPEGTVESWIVNHQPFVPGRRDPYLVVMARLTAVPGCLVHGNWRAARPPKHLEPVVAVFTEVEAEVTLVDWTPADV
ncbi:Zn-ribbon domain-containing OB-fold protein [Nonomuraea candida]|uniref:Zn-ribbon domain-containing OB-fold protein n=1 Tax=Nonomuraea candida TaxID=359159 RepID=UPI0005BB48E5|nr:zinc ribbon domain-containing protein [Nonomuraea candida]